MTTPSYESRLRAAWLCKNIGGTLGAPYEGYTGFMHLSYYDPVPTATAPNDDLDLQLVWLQMIREKGLFLTPADFLPSWKDNIVYHISEYHIAQRNIARGFLPPVTGHFDNWYHAGMGAIIRAEIWSCIAPGDPLLAALYAYMDGSVDHSGEGVYAEVFFAVMESAAFTESSPRELIRVALRYIPSDCEIARAVCMAVDLYDTGAPLHSARTTLCAHFAHPADFTHSPLNLGFIILGLLYGTDFSSAVCATVNCGYDTDCTAASAASLYGIIHGVEAIPQKWSAPIGEEVKAGWGIRGVIFPPDITALCKEISSLRNQATANRAKLVDHLLRWTGISPIADPTSTQAIQYPPPGRVTLGSTPDHTVRWDYTGLPVVEADGTVAASLHLINHGSGPASFSGCITTPAGDTVSHFSQTLESGEFRQIPFETNARLHGREFRIQWEGATDRVLPTIVYQEPRSWKTLEVRPSDLDILQRIEGMGRIPDDCSTTICRLPGDSIATLVPRRNNIRFAQVELAVDRAVRIRLVLNCTGPLEAWLNGSSICRKRYQSTGFSPSAHLQRPNPGTFEIEQNNGHADIVLPEGASTLLLRLDPSREEPDGIVHAMGLTIPENGIISASCFKPLATDPFDLAANRMTDIVHNNART